jgi:phosphoglycolate phosphatase
MDRVQAIIFDKDGTLFDFRATWGGWAERLLDKLSRGDAGLRAAAGEAIGVIPGGGGFRADSIVIANTQDEIASVLSGVVAIPAGEIVGLANAIAADTTLVPAVALEACLGELGRGRLLGLVTNDSEVPARIHLEKCGIAEHFAFVAGYDSGFGAKPDPGPLLAFCRVTGAEPGGTLMVGDSRHDLAAGRAAGMRTVAVLTGVAGADELSDLADVVLADIGLLAEWIEAQDRAI